ncbi:MAG TPA: class I tRNA ligase family protein [Bacteroidales bacterium]|nr:class I tRNA ligase family protein [Bacteroidales bacterium]HPS17541.1 class I tRNA ligase family protein [Bacteroidales bacterium]
MDYNFREIEPKWQKYWSDNKTYKAENPPAGEASKPKYYVLDMFPYPSGAGLHVGHPLGYIASDIYARFKRLKGFNVLHPMGYDAYGLPAEQYAIQTGTHPAITTEKNLARYREQLDKIGFSFDWDREVKTCDPKYYKWTQWTFIQLFKSWYNKKDDKAEAIEILIKEFEKNGNTSIQAACSDVQEFSSSQWKAMNEKEQQEILMNYRLAYLADTMVNWCPALGTVLANDEVSEGFSVRGGHPVERKTMKQWSLRITAYAERLLNGLDEIDWSDSIKEIQRNWIGKSEGAMVKFAIKGHENLFMEIFTTRPDTIFGVTYMTFAPEHEYVNLITTSDRKEVVEKYVTEAKNRSERERMADVKRISGEFTGAYAINPFTNEEIPIWVGDYVLAGYGTGAVMAVPGHDTRDWAFANHFNLPIKEVIAGGDITKEAYDSYDGTVVNSGFINGMKVPEAKKAVIKKVEEMGIGYGKTNYRLRDAIFSRQRYWGEPFPIYYKDGIPYAMDEAEIIKNALELPAVDAYLPTETGEPPLARAKNWKTKEGYPIETSTMPGFAGSSAYYLRYMDPWNDKEYFSKEANKYWENVDLYIGGAEHATGHLMYARFWNKFLFDLGLVCKEEPFKKLINQGMIQGKSEKIYYEGFASYESGSVDFNGLNLYNVKTKESFKNLEFFYYGSPIELPNGPFQIFYSADIKETFSENNELHIKTLRSLNIPIVFVDNSEINLDELIDNWGHGFEDSFFITNNSGFYYKKKFWKYDKEKNSYEPLDKLPKGCFKTFSEVEKMSKSKYNVVTPDDLIEKYGADTLRLYEMFLGPLEQHKPWDTKGIEGVFRFIRKLWRLYHDTENNFCVSDDAPTKDELKVLHKTIKKVQDDIERFSFNTAVSNFMICVNDLSDLKCNKRSILSDLAIIISPYAPHIAEELWSLLGNKESVTKADFPTFNEEYLVENNCTYAVSFNGKMRFTLELPVDMPGSEVERNALTHKDAAKWLEGKTPKKIIVVPKKIVNVVI